MLLLVLVAAFIFLFQGRQVLEQQKDAADSALSQTQQELDITYQSLDNSTSLLATAEATNLLLEGQLVESQQELDGVVAALATRDAEFSVMAGERNEFLSQPPAIEILQPTNEAEIVVGQPVTYDLFVADVVGVTAVIVSIDGEQFRTYSLFETPTERIQDTWIPTSVGEVVFGVQASNARTSVLVTETLTIENAATQTLPLAQIPFAEERAEVETAVRDIRGLDPTELDEVTAVFSPDLEPEDLTPQLPGLSYDTTWLVWSLFDFEPEDFVQDRTAVPFRYDPQADSLAINNPGQSFDALDAYAYAEAYATLLLDQIFANFDNQSLPLDQQMALRALRNADVATVLNTFLTSDYFSPSDVTIVESAQQRAPFAQWLTGHGRDFVNFLSEDSNSSLNTAWTTLPASTEQVLHPQKYQFSEPPLLVELPDVTELLGEGWVILAEETLGEGLLRYYLSRHLNEDQVETAATGWGGDRFTVLQSRGGELVLVYKIVWDSLNDSNEFAALYPNYPTRLLTAAGTLNDRGECWEGDEVICLYQNQSETLIIRAADLETAINVGNFVSNQ